MFKTPAPWWFRVFEFWKFEFVSNFEIRILDFGKSSASIFSTTRQ